MDSFQAKIDWRRMRKSENKNYRSVSFLLDAKWKIAKKLKILKKIPLWLHFKPKLAGKVCEKEKIKIILPFHSYLRRDRKF